MTEGNARPAQLRDAAMTIAYQRWLGENALEDTDANAWRFVAESGATHRPVSVENSSSRRPVWVPVAIVMSVVAILTVFVVFTFASAEHWIKVDAEEVGHYVDVGDGTWNVSMDDKDVCYVGQDWDLCIDEHTSEWNFACAEKYLDASSKTLCDNYYDMIQEMRADSGGPGWEVETLGTWGRLASGENMTQRWVVDEAEKTHQAVCYLGFLGECEE